MSKFFELANLEGRTALITGATGKLGSTFALTLANLGANVILVDLPESNFDELESSILESSTVKVSKYRCNLESEIDRKVMIAALKESHNVIDVLVNNAAFVGTADLPGWTVAFEEQNLQTWRRAFEVNLTAVFDLCQKFSPELRKSKNGSIINIASIYGLFGPDWDLYEGTNLGNPAAYAVSKGGLVQLTRWLAATIGPDVRVNAIAPGGLLRDQSPEFINRYSKKNILGRMGSEEDLVGAIAYFASDLSKYVTGQILSIDGGWGVK